MPRPATTGRTAGRLGREQAQPEGPAVLPTLRQGLGRRRLGARAAVLLLRSSWLPAVAFLLAVCFAGLDDRLRLSHDGGIYVSLAQALCTGQGYREIYLPEAPVHRQYPPLYPFQLALAVCPVGVNVFAIKSLMLAMSAAALVAVYALFRALRGPSTAWRLAALTAATPALLYYFQAAMSEVPYLLCSALALWWVVRPQEDRAWSWTGPTVTAALLAAASTTRLIGLSLIVAVCLYVLLERPGRLVDRLRSILIMGGLGSLPVVAWLLFNRLSGYATGTTYVEYYRRDLGGRLAGKSMLAGIADVTMQAGRRLYDYALHLGGLITYPLDALTGVTLAPIAAAIVLAGFAYCAVRRRTVLEYYVAVYAGMLLIFPGSRQQRYLIPLIPIVWYHFLSAITAAYRFSVRHRWVSQPSARRRMAFALRGAVSILAVALAGATLALTRDQARGVPSQRAMGAYHAAVYPWVKQHTPPDSLIAWANPAVGFVASGRKAVQIPRGHPAMVVGGLHRAHADYVVVDSVWRASRPLAHAVAAHPDHFTLVYRFRTATVYKVVRERALAPGAPIIPSG